MPTSEKQITDEFRRVYGQMVDDRPFAPEWEDLWAEGLHFKPATRRHPGWMAAVAAAVVTLVAIGGVAILAGNPPSSQEAVSGADSPTTTLTTPVARMTVIFTPGGPSDTEWESFISVLRNYSSSVGYVPVDEETARQQALDFFADDPDALDALNEYPHIASGYAHVDFAERDEAFAFQEEVSRLDFVVAAVGENGPHLGRGYVPLADLDTDDLRGSFWQYAYSSGASPQNPGPPSPELSQEDQAELIVTAIRIACSDLCVGQPLYFRDQLLDIDTLDGEEEPMPEATRTAIEDAYPEVVWVDFDAADEILEQVDNAEAVLLSVSGFSELAPGVQGVDVGIIHGAFHGQTIQFQWNRSEWIQADSEDTGVTVTSVVS